MAQGVGALTGFEQLGGLITNTQGKSVALEETSHTLGAIAAAQTQVARLQAEEAHGAGSAVEAHLRPAVGAIHQFLHGFRIVRPALLTKRR